MEAQTHAATGLLSRLLMGLALTSLTSVGGDELDFAMDDIEETGPGAMSAKVILPSGDTYQVTVAWISEDSP